MKRRVIGLVVVLLGGMAAWADSTWKGQSGKWSVADNWEGGVPTAADIAVFPKNTAGYTVEVDEDVECKFIRGDSNVDGKGTKITFTGAGKLTASGTASGPSVNSYAQVGYEMIFENITATIAAFNPYDGTLTIGDGADVTIGTAFYINGQTSKVVVNGGLLTVPGADIRTKCSVTVNGGTLNMQSKTANVRTDGVVFAVNGGLMTGARFNFAYNSVNRADTVRLTGGTLALGGAAPLNFDKCTIDIAGGTLVWHSDSSFDAVKHGAWAPKAGAKLVLPCDSYTALAVQPGDTLDVDGDVYATNNLAYVKEHPSDTKAPGFFLNTNSVLRGEGSLYANYMFVRSTTTVEVASLNLGHRIHFAKSDSVLMVPKGLTFGAYDDWSSKYQNAYSYFFGPIIVETTDCFDGETPRTITFGRTVLDALVDYRVKGCGTNDLWVGNGGAIGAVRSLTVDPGATFKFSGNYDGKAGRLDVGSLILTAESKLVTVAGTSSVRTKSISLDPTAEIEVVVDKAPTEAKAISVVQDSGLSDLASRVTLTGAYADRVQAKSVGGVLYLTDGTTPELKGDLPAHTWTGAAGGNWSEASNWYSNAVPVNSATTAKAAWPHFCGTRNTVVTNDLTGSQEDYRGGAGIFGLYFDETCAPYEIHGNSIRLSPQGYSGDNAAFYSKSKNPVVVYAPLWRASKIGIILQGGSYAQFMGPVEASGSNGDFYFRGDIRIGGAAKCRGFITYTAYSDNPNRLTIMRGGSLYVSNNTIQDTFGESNKDESGRIDVDEGGSFVVAAPVLQPGKTAYTCRIDGYFAASNGVRFLKSSSFNGMGTVYFGGVSNTNVTRTLSFGGGITLAMGGDWNVVTAENPATPVKLKATGDMKLVAAADWTYGPETGVETAADWAMAVAADATLTIGKSDFAMRIAEPVVVEGGVAFENGAKLVLTGALAALAEADWTPVVTAKAVTGEPLLAGRCRVRTVENDDGTVTLEAKERKGMLILVK